MTRLCIRGGRPLRGRARVPADLRLGQQALLWAALSDGVSRVFGLSQLDDHARLCTALGALGVEVRSLEAGYEIHGVGLGGLCLKAAELSAGDSVSTLELLTALVAPQPFGLRIAAAGAAAAASIAPLLHTLRQRGLAIAARQEGEAWCAPVSSAPCLPGELVDAIEIAIPYGDPGVKLALLLSGLYAGGVTVVREGVASADHTERALRALGAPVEYFAGCALLDGAKVNASGLSAFDWRVPGDFTLATYLLVAALLVPGSRVQIEGVGVNPTRTGVFDALRLSGIPLGIQPRGDQAGDEPTATLEARSTGCSRMTLAGEVAVRCAGELGALAVLFACARERVSIRDVSWLRTRRPGQLDAWVRLLSCFGANCTLYHDGFDIDGAPQASGLTAARIPAHEPPENKLLACILGCAVQGETVVEAPETMDALYPGFGKALASLGADIFFEEADE